MDALLATHQARPARPGGSDERRLVTLGQDLSFLPGLLHRHGSDYSAADVISYLLGR